MIELLLVPADAPGRYVAFHDMRALCTSRRPFYDAARVLMREGVPPETELTARHRGSGIVALRSTVGEAAKWTVGERDLGRLHREVWKTSPHAPRPFAVTPDFAREAAE